MFQKASYDKKAIRVLDFDRQLFLRFAYHVKKILFVVQVHYFLHTFQVSENAIIDLPTGVVAFHMDRNEPRIPGRAISHNMLHKMSFDN